MSSVGARLDGFLSRHVGGTVPESRDLPRWLSPLPEWLENVGFRLLWAVVCINLLGTLFGFWFYWVQLQETPIIMWIIVPVSPLATLYMALSLASWRLGLDAEWLHMLAFFGCLKYGLWTPFVQLYVNGPGLIEPWLYQFLIWSHLAMVVQAFLITRYATFPVWAVGVATGWYVLNDVLDYFVAIFDGPHHTWVTGLDVSVFDGPIETWITGVRVGRELERALGLYFHVAAFAVGTTILAVFLALATRVALVERRGHERASADAD